jgi:hypothetical protein
MNNPNKRKLTKNRFNKPTAEQKSNLSKFNLDYA